jgi:hypothetical protein
VPDTHANFAYLPALGFRSVCDLNPPLLLGAALLGGLVAAGALLGWLCLRRRRTAGTPKSFRQPAIGEDGYAEGNRPH